MKRTFLMIAFAALATIAYSQTDNKGYEEGKYVLKGVSGLSIHIFLFVTFIVG